MDYLQAYAYAVLLFNSSMDDKVSLQLARKVATLILTKSRTKFWMLQLLFLNILVRFYYAWSYLRLSDERTQPNV